MMTMSPATDAALTVAERFSAIECAVLDRWPEATVESNPTGATMFITTPRASVIVAIAFTTFSDGCNVFIRRYDGVDDMHRMTVEGSALHVADEVAEILQEHFGPSKTAARA